MKLPTLGRRTAVAAAHNGDHSEAVGPEAPHAPLPQKVVDFFFREGFLILRNFFTRDEVEIVNRAVDRVWDNRTIYNPVTISACTGGIPDYIETFVRCVPLEARQRNHKINHLYLADPSVLELLLQERLQAVLRQLLDGTPLLFNGLNMEQGTEQAYHFDTFYMPPRTRDRMAVTWIALEDIHPDSGPLQYYPRSHLIEPYVFSDGGVLAIDDEMPAFDRYIEAELTERDLTSERFIAQAGDMFIWHAQLFHGGSPVTDRRHSRRSMVNHFWRVEDMPAEMCMELRPGRWMMEPRFMPVPTNFSADLKADVPTPAAS